MPMDYYRLPESEVLSRAKIPITCLEDQATVFARMADEMFDTIEEHNREGRPTVFILPYGPTGEYPIFVEKVNRRRLSLKRCWFIAMDDYLTPEGDLAPVTSIHSLRRKFQDALYSRIDPELLMPESQRVHPDPRDLTRIPKLIEALGGVDICFGGFGINGHLGFNEPEEMPAEAFATLPTRVIRVSDVTVTIKASGPFCGAMEDIPRGGITVGMAEMLGARRVSVYCFRDWHTGAVRRAACGEVSALFPASLLQNHPNAGIICSKNAFAPAY